MQTIPQKAVGVAAMVLVTLFVAVCMLILVASVFVKVKEVLLSPSLTGWIASWHIQQDGYTHTSGQLNIDDRAAIRVVENSALGKPELLRVVVGESSKPLNSCTYWVQKVIHRDAQRYSDGRYPEHFEVTCFTTESDDSAELEFAWEVENETVRAFHWGAVPVD
jgi:hypothetical protein